MPWLSIISWLVSYFMSTKSGMSKGKAALLATGVAAGTYFLADPANKDNVLGLSFGSGKAAPGDVSIEGTPSTVEGSAPSGWTKVGTQLIASTADVAKSWGPLGTAGVVGTATGALTGDNKWLWIGGGLLLLMLLKK